MHSETEFPDKPIIVGSSEAVTMYLPLSLFDGLKERAAPLFNVSGPEYLDEFNDVCSIMGEILTTELRDFSKELIKGLAWRWKVDYLEEDQNE